MLGKLFGKRAKKEVPPPFAMGTEASNPMDMEFLHEVHARVFQTYLRSGKFQGSFDTANGFTCQTMPNGMQVAVQKDQKFQAIMAEHQIGLSGVGYTSLHWTMVHFTTFAKHFLNGEPTWETAQDGLTGILPFGNTAALTLDCKDLANIDFDFSGRADKGATFIIQVNPRNLQ